MSDHLPHKENCVVQREKIVGYIMDETHRDGRSKARFFSKFGFSKDQDLMLSSALVSHGQTRPVVTVKDDGYGPKYTVECEVATPDGRTPCIASVWILEPGSTKPRFVTAYPGSRKPASPVVGAAEYGRGK